MKGRFGIGKSGSLMQFVSRFRAEITLINGVCFSPKLRRVCREMNPHSPDCWASWEDSKKCALKDKGLGLSVLVSSLCSHLGDLIQRIATVPVCLKGSW